MNELKPIKIRDQDIVTFKVFEGISTDLDHGNIDKSKDIAIVLLSEEEIIPSAEEIREIFNPFLSVLFGYRGEKPLQKLVNSIDTDGLVNVDLADLRNLVKNGYGIIRYKNCEKLKDIGRWDRGLIDIKVNKRLSIKKLEEIIGDFLHLREFVWGLKVNSVHNPKALSIMINDWNSDKW